MKRTTVVVVAFAAIAAFVAGFELSHRPVADRRGGVGKPEAVGSRAMRRQGIAHRQPEPTDPKPPAFIRQEGEFRIFPGARADITPEVLSEWLERPTPWRGATPVSVNQLPNDRFVRKRVVEYEETYGKGALERKLNELSTLDGCLKANGVRGPGAVALMVKFTPDETGGELVASKVILEASNLPVSDKEPFIDCADRSFLGRRRPAVRGTAGAASPDTIQVPVSNHALYRWLLEPDHPDE